MYELNDQEVQNVSGAEGEAYDNAKEVGVAVAEALEDAAAYVRGFFSGLFS